MKYKTIDTAKSSTREIQSILTTAIAPRPIAFASTIDKNGIPNLSPFSFFNAFGANPPILIFSPARRGRDNTTKHTFENIRDVPEVVINVVNHDIIQQVSLTSADYAKGVNEFSKAGLTEIASETIKPPRVMESPVQFECSVQQIIETGNEGGAGNLVICHINKIHIAEKVLNSQREIDPQLIDLVGRMGGDNYIRCKEAVFSIPKPLNITGIGVDALPKNIRESEILTGSNLALLASVDRLPSKDEIKKMHFGDNSEPLDMKHLSAQNMIEDGQVWEALCYLMD